MSHAVYGVAETGSVVLAAAPDEPRSASLFPEIHLTLLESDRILPGLDELFAAVGDSLPSSLALVSGPSRSADIELILALGVHGPREVHVAVIDPGHE